MSRLVTLLGLVCLFALPTTACEFFEQLNDTVVDPVHAVPEVDTSEPELRDAPEIMALAAYYCPTVVGNPLFGLGCSAALGPAPPASDLTFELGVTMTIANEADVPIPTLDVLLALTLFDGEDAESVGAICVSMCPADAVGCDGTPKDASACEAPAGSVDSLSDYATGVAGLIEGLAEGQSFEELTNASELLAGGDVTVDLTFALGVEQALNIIETTAEAWVDDAMAGQVPSLNIPVAIEGTVFFEMPVAGRFGVPFGPSQATWLVD